MAVKTKRIYTCNIYGWEYNLKYIWCTIYIYIN